MGLTCARVCLLPFSWRWGGILLALALALAASTAGLSVWGSPSLLFPKGGTVPSTPDLTPTALPDPRTPSLSAR